MGNLLCCYIVKESTVAVKQSCGKYDKTLEAGCHCVPWIMGSHIAGKLTKRLQQVDVICETQTEDNVFVKLKALIRYRALGDDKAHEALSEFRNKNSMMVNHVLKIITDTVRNLKFAEVFVQKQNIANNVKDELEKAMPSSDYGFEIVETLIIDIDTDECVKKAVNAKFAATKLNEAAIIKAEAENIFQRKRAEGKAESMVRSGSGIVGQTMAIVNGLNGQCTLKEAMEMVLVTRYFDALKETGASSSAAVHEAVTWIR